MTVTAGAVTVLRTAALSGAAATGTLSFLSATDNTSVLALSDLAVADADCTAFEVRLDDGLEVVPLTADIVAGTAASFTEPLGADFDPGMFDQVSDVIFLRLCMVSVQPIPQFPKCQIRNAAFGGFRNKSCRNFV